MSGKPTKEYAKETPSDLAALWQDAVTEYCVTAKMELSQMKFYTKIDQILGDRDVQNNFEKFRHNGGKVDKLRTVINRNADLITTSAGYIGQAVSVAFPPSTAILTALTYVMKASGDVSKDYDKITAFFEELQAFLERIADLEAKVPDFSGFKSHLMRVFTAIMKMLGLATKATKEGRMKRFGKTILRGGIDDELAGATGTFEVAMKRLESATITATLANTEDIKRDTKDVKKTVISIVGLATDMSADLKQMPSHFDRVIAEFHEFSAKFDRDRESRQRLLDTPTGTATAQKMDSSHRSSSLSVVKRHFTVLDDPQARDREFEFHLIEGTTQWFLEHHEFLSWKEGTSSSPYLWVNGEAGMGKSFLAYSAIRELQKSTASDINAFVAYYYFRQETSEGRPIQHMLSAAVNQIAKLDKTYCDQVATELMVADEPIRWFDSKPIFEKYIASKFQKKVPQIQSAEKEPVKNDALGSDSPEDKTPNHLFLVLDGIDEMPFSADQLFESLEKIATDESNIRVLLTSRPEMKHRVEKLKDLKSINITKDTVRDDTHAIITAKLKGASRLRKLRSPVKKAIAARLLNQADGLLYIDHALRRLNKYHGEGMVLSVLNDLPTTLSGLYAQLDEEATIRRTPEQLQTIRLVCAWIAFGKESIVVEQVNDIVKLRGLDHLFSIEEEISSRLGMILTISEKTDPDISESDDDDDSDHAPEEAAPIALNEPLAPSVDTFSIVRFHNRSLQDYFRGATIASTGVRTPQAQADLLMFEMCAQIVTRTVEFELCEKLLQYAATNWALHFIDIDLSIIGDDDVLRGISLLYDLLTNKNDVAEFLESHFQITTKWLPYTSILVRPGGRKGGRVTKFQTTLVSWLDRADGLDLSTLGPQISGWAQTARAQPGTVLVDLARAHVRNWLKFSGNKVIPYTFAVSALNFTNVTSEFIGLNKARQEWAIEMAFKAFLVMDSDATAYRSLAITLCSYKHYYEAREQAQSSFSKSSNDRDKFAALLEQGTAEFHIARTWGCGYDDDDDDEEEEDNEDGEEGEDEDEEEGEGGEGEEDENDGDDDDDDEEEEWDEENGPNAAYQRPYDTFLKALKIRPTDQNNESNELVRRALSLLGSCQYQLCKYHECVASIEEARTIKTDSLMTGETLSLIPAALYECGAEGYAQLIAKLQEWNFFDLLAWLTFDYDWSEDWDPHRIFQRVAKETGHVAFAIEVYEQIINFLEPRRSAGRVRNSLAHFAWNVNGDLNKAKELWLKTANSEVHVNPASGCEDDQPIWDAYLSAANTIYEQFRTSSSPREKIALLEGMRDLQESRDSGPLQAVDTYGVAPAVVHANMIRKIGSEQDFEEVLTEAFDSCYTALTDGEAWNDVQSLCLLAKILALVGGLEREAQIVFSAQFSLIDPKGMQDHWESHDDWGDIVPFAALYCECGANYITDWSKGPLYLCLICTDVKICQQCYDRLQKYNQDGNWDHWKKYCGKGHKYIKGPIDGWGGIREGVMTIGEERVSFIKWLHDLKENKWKQSWNTFWTREDNIPDIV